MIIIEMEQFDCKEVVTLVQLPGNGVVFTHIEVNSRLEFMRLKVSKGKGRYEENRVNTR
jgi:hypothetical protein